jgi:prolyl oligopeptidase
VPIELNTIPGVEESIHGIAVIDPYRWLEDRDSPATERWIADQRVRLDGYFGRLGQLDRLRHRTRAFLDVETIDQAGKVLDRYFYRKRLAGEEQPSIYVKASRGRSERLLVSPSGEGSFVAIGIHRIAADASLLAYEIKQGGEHSKSIHIVDVDTGTILPDHLDRGLARGFGFRYTRDGFYYCHDSAYDDAPHGKDHEIRFHRFGTAACDDAVLLSLPRVQMSKLVLISDGPTLGAIYCHSRGDGPAVDLYMAEQDRHDAWICVGTDFPAPFIPFLYRGRLFAERVQGAPNGEIVELDRTNGLPLRVIAPAWRIKINDHAIAGNRLFIHHMSNGTSCIRVWSLDGEFLGALPLDEGSSWRVLPGFTNEADELLLRCESFTRPPSIFSWQPLTGQFVVWNQRPTPISACAVTARRLSYTSKDGTEVAMSLVGSEDSLRLGDRPIIMTAYGGFGAMMPPRFSPFVSMMVELGFLFALPEIRGGGERGPEWHEAARGRNRQVAFGDFIAAAEWLCEKGLGNPRKLAVFGGSNSGILVGAAITQRPDLFRAALCIAPLLDMVRYHLFDRARIWATEFGTADNAEEFHALLGYSPYHHINEDVNYPAVLFVSGDQDSRCNPAHARKMAARLQERAAQEHAILLDHSRERGHAPTMPLSVRIDALTNRIAFLCHELEVPFLQEAHRDTACD